MKATNWVIKPTNDGNSEKNMWITEYFQSKVEQSKTYINKIIKISRVNIKKFKKSKAAVYIGNYVTNL